jgi:NitT/TauT family transport system substrate-binding protein
MPIIQSRRRLLAGLSAAGAAGVLGSRGVLAEEGPPETTTVRLPFNSNLCVAPQYVADDLLRAEGFTDIRYVPSSGGLTEPQMAGSGEIDFGITTAAVLPFQMVPVTALAGVHPAAMSCLCTGASKPLAI